MVWDPGTTSVHLQANPACLIQGAVYHGESTTCIQWLMVEKAFPFERKGWQFHTPRLNNSHGKSSPGCKSRLPFWSYSFNYTILLSLPLKNLTHGSFGDCLEFLGNLLHFGLVRFGGLCHSCFEYDFFWSLK